MKEFDDLYLFEFFYSFKTLWKKYHNNKIEGLYKLLARNDAGNKAMMNLILVDLPSSFDSKKKNLGDLMGIPYQYFRDMDNFVPIKSLPDWEEFAVLHKKGTSRTGTESRRHRELRFNIELELQRRAEKSELEKKNEAFDRLVIFCKYGKKADETIDDNQEDGKEEKDVSAIILNVIKEINSVSKENLMNADKEKTKQLQESLTKLLHRIEAIEVIKSWE